MPRARSARVSAKRLSFSTTFPNIGREGVLAGTRELVVPSLPYIVVHRIETGDEPAVTILGVYHGAQMRPGQSAT